MKTVPELVSSFAQFEKDQDEWDAMPMMLLIFAPDGDDDDPVLIMVALGMDGDLPDNLVAIAVAITKGGTPPWGHLDKGDPLGLIVIFEGWGVASKDPVEMAKVQAYTAAGGRLVDHPLAVESKWVTGIDDAGMYSAHFVRGGDEIHSIDDRKGAGTGRLPDAVTAVWTAMKS